MAGNAIGWQAPCVTPELGLLVDDVRRGRDEMRHAISTLSATQADALTRTLIMGEAAPACQPPLDPAQSTIALCDQALVARGPLDQGAARLLLRERARLHLHVTGMLFALRSRDDLLALWDEATRAEPIIRLFIDEPRWRVAADGVPFTGVKFAAIFGPKALSPGNVTANPEDIPLLVDEVIAFAARTDLPSEVIACGMSYLLFRIHPFKDGNGHTLRMLTCSLMHAAGYDEPTLLVYLTLLRERHDEMCELSSAVSLGSATTEDHVAFHLSVIRCAQRAVLDMLQKC